MTINFYQIQQLLQIQNNFAIIYHILLIISKSTQHSPKHKMIQYSPEQALQIMQCGNIDLNFLVEYGILLLGCTKVGKTTTAHYLTHQVLEGGLNDVKSVVYLLKSGEKKYQNAKIGQFQTQSETQIPNFFDYEENGKKIYLVDCPGYIDSYGCYRVVSNRFFHYQVFSKVENIKFVITFTFADMNKTAENMKRTFKQFLKGFTNLQDVKQKIINATSIMITTTPKQKDLQGVREKYRATPVIPGEFKQFYIELKEALLNNNRVFMFHAAELGVPCNTKNNMLKDINAVTTFWKRNINKYQQIDMTNVKISMVLSQEELQVFREDLDKLSAYYKEHVQKDIKKFIQVLTCLSKDNQTGGESAEFIKKIITFCEQKKHWREKESKYTALYKKYAEKRGKLIQSLFKPSKLTNSDTVNNSNQVPFWFVRLKAQKKIEELNQTMASTQKNQRQTDALSQQMSSIKNILDILISLVNFKKQRDSQKQSLKNQAVMEFAYQIYKDIDISNKLYKIVKKTTSENKKNSIKDIQKGMNFILVQYPSTLKGMFLKAFSKNATQIFIENLPKMKIDENLSSKAAGEVALFLEEFKNKILTSQISHTFQPQYTQALKGTLDNFIVKLNNNVFQSLKRTVNPSLSHLKQMQEKRVQIIQKIKESKQNAYNNEKLKAENNRTLQLMAECLLRNSKLDLALQIYDSLYDGFKVLQIMETQYEFKKSKNQNSSDVELLNHLLLHMRKAGKYQRKELAFQRAQEAYHLAQNLADTQKINQIGSFIKEVSQNRFAESELYLEVMFEDVKQVNISRQLSQKIIKLAENAPGSEKKIK